MTIEQKTDNVEEGSRNLLPQFQNSVDFKAILVSYLKQIQDIEDMFFELEEELKLANAVGAQVDGYGSKIDEAREARSDANYKLAIEAKKLLNASNGTVEELIVIILAYIGNYSTADTKSTVTLDQLYLMSGATIPSGNKVSMGLGGEQFETLTTLTNSAGYRQIMSVSGQAVNAGRVFATAGTINTIVDTEIGWIEKAVVQSGSSPFALTNGQTLILEVDGGPFQTFTFLTGDFVDINNATADEVRIKIWSTLAAGGTTLTINNKVWIESDTVSTGTIQVTGGTAAVILGFPNTLIKGMHSSDATEGLEKTQIDFVKRPPAAYTATIVNSITPLGIDPIKVARALDRATIGGVNNVLEYHGDEPVLRFDTGYYAGFGASSFGSGGAGSSRGVGGFDRAKFGGAL